MAVRCPECGLRYRGVKDPQQLTVQKVEAHEKGYSHAGRIATLSRKAKKG